MTLHQQLAAPTVLKMDRKRKEGQRPAPGHRSSSGGWGLDQRVVTGNLVRLQLACPKQSVHFPTSILSPCTTDSASEPASPGRNPSGIRLRPQAGQSSRSAAAPALRPSRRRAGCAEGGLGEAGVGAAGAVSPLAALHHAGHLQAGHH